MVAGDVDITAVGRLQAELDAALARSPVLIDVSAVTFFSCAAGHILRDIQHSAPGSLTVVGAGRPVRRLLEIMHLDPLLTTGALAA